ncbi:MULTISPECIES: class II glutamine amidotransferase [Deefgea]|uniref:Class II glutamine amidotransferase n=1 Tax=Deefgea chitinilytica TaxID=570276 RepID=A0ABS2CCX4_9NEIS|nr:MULTISPECIES: class II glutamine amidotransferase [Deefgea]MBM5571993.1 class II glutamine amidotransferase [Deefgea chitinilytica]MBM9889228.1 class II glutamine amidotransferase [Deefgea sp. CFH1-16]
MCQLLGMNCNTPTDIVFSFEGFRCRGGLTDEHADGWGIAFFEDNGCRLFLDYLPSISSPVADLVRSYPIKSKNVIAHIRKATQGQINLANTHPFQRELWGRYWIFAHNGNLTDLPALGQSRFQTVGNTDSEHAFCWILNQLSQQFSAMPNRAQLHAAMKQLAQQLALHGTCNFLLSDGDTLFAHCSTALHYIVRQAPFTVAHLSDMDMAVDFSTETTPNDRVAMIATQPLTDNETWTAMQAGELLMFVDGTTV